MSGYKKFDMLTMKNSIFRLQTALKKQYQKAHGENHLEYWVSDLRAFK